MSSQTFFIARCPEHGLHGLRQECFECGGPIEPVEVVLMADHAAVLGKLQRATDALEEITTVKGQQGSEARRMAEAALADLRPEGTNEAM